jgi:tRNA(Ile)-lysidine synthetase-like protein
MALLDLLSRAAPERHYQLVVAHFDHGLRPDSAADRALAQTTAQALGWPFVYHEAQLGRASEATARAVRYAWLETVRQEHGAAAIVTAHHQDDLLETSLLNLARGSGRRGLAPMQNRLILRPLLGVSRAQLRRYAQARALTWREDPTNADLANPRNLIRHQLLAAASPAWRRQYLALLAKLAQLNAAIDQELATHLPGAPVASSLTFSRASIQGLSLAELEEILIIAAQRLQPGIELNQRLVQELALFAKTGAPGRHRPIRQDLRLVITPSSVQIRPSK